MDKNRKLPLVQFSILLIIEAVVCFTPLGFLPAMGPVVVTLVCIPVIITAIYLGIGWGALMGFFFGLFSYISSSFLPPGPAMLILAPFYSFGDLTGNFWSLAICFIPSIMVGVVTGVFYNLFRRLLKSNFMYDIITFGVSGFLGSMSNTLLVVGGIYIFFGEHYNKEYGFNYSVLISSINEIILTNGIPEAVLGGFVAFFIGRILIKHQRVTNH